MNNTGDGIYIEGGFDNDQINGAIEETLKRVQGLSDGTASAGASMDSTFNDIQQKVTTALNAIDKNIEFNKNEIKNLQAQYKTLGAEMKAALASGNTSLAKDKQAAIQAIDREIVALANENKELERSKQKVAETAQAWADNQKKQNENAQAHVTLRQRIKEVREEMANLVITAQKNGVQLDETTGRYAELKEELGRLGDIQDDIGQQMRMLANDERQIAGVINGLSGLSGGLSAATGAVSLFAGENENLQKVMTKLQSVMAITMGLQQLQQTLNKDSAFRLTTLASIKQWWGKVEAEANAKAAASTALDTAAKNQNTAAQERNTAAKTANTASTAANTASEVVNAGATSAAGAAASKSAGLFTKLGVAMKSLPKLGWAGLLVGGLIAAVSSVIKKIREVQGAIDEMNTKIAEGATEPVAKIKELQVQWNNLGDDLDKKKKFVDDNKDAFHNLGVEVKDVADAERILNEQTDAFINAQMARAKAMALNEEASKKTKELLKAQADLETTPKQIERTVIHRSTGTYTSYMTDNPAYAKAQQKVKQLESEIHNLYQRVIDENNAAATELENAGIRAAKKSTETTVTNSVKTTTETAEAILKKELAAVKARYEEFYSWVNSGDKGARDAARTEFADLVEQGSTYLEFLKRKRDELTAAIAGGTATNEQAEQMRVLNDQIAQETKETVLSQFEAQLQSEMQGAQSLVDMLDIIKRKKDEVTNESGNTEILSEEDRQRIEELGRQMEESYNGNVDLLHRKIIEAQQLVEKGWADAGNGIATLYSSLYDEDIFQNGVETQIMITPILPDGSVLSPEELDEYVYNELSGAENILDADRLGLVIHVGDNEDNGFHLHEMQEEYYDIIDFWNRANTQINSEKTEVVSEAEKQLSEKIAQRTSALLEEYRSFNDRLVALDDAYNNDVAILERAYAEAKTDEEKKRIEDALAARRKAYDNARQGILDSEAKTLAESSDAYLALFNVASGASKRMLKQVLADAQAVLRAVKGEVVELPAGISQELIDKLKQSPEELQELYRQVLDLQEQVNRESGYPFASLVQGFKELKTSAELAAKAEKEVDAAARKATSDMANVTRDKALQSLASGAAEALNKIGELGDKMKDLGDAIGDSGLANMGETMSGLSSILSDVAAGASAGGGWGALIGGVLGVLSTMFDSYSEYERQAHQNALAASDFAHAVTMLNLQLKDTYDNGFGERAFARIADAVRVAKEALAAYLDLYNGYTYFQNEDGSYYTKPRPTSLAEIRDSGWELDWIKNARVQTYDANWWQEFWGTASDEYTKITDLAPGILEPDGSINPDVAEAFLNSYGDMLDDATRQSIQQAIDTKRAYIDALEAIGDAAVEVFGYLGDEARSSLVDALMNGGDAWESWKKKGSKAIETLGEELMYELFLATQFDNFKERIKKIYQDNAENPEEAARLAGEAMSQFFDEAHASMDAAQAWGEEWQRYWKEKGFDIWSNDDESANSFYGAARTVTETTASLIHGQMNAMRVNQVSQGDILRQQLLMLSSIKSDTAYLRSIDNRLRNIESRTSGTQYAARINH